MLLFNQIANLTVTHKSNHCPISICGEGGGSYDCMPIFKDQLYSQNAQRCRTSLAQCVSNSFICPDDIVKVIMKPYPRSCQISRLVQSISGCLTEKSDDREFTHAHVLVGDLNCADSRRFFWSSNLKSTVPQDIIFSSWCGSDTDAGSCNDCSEKQSCASINMYTHSFSLRNIVRDVLIPGA
jgi:hypothetical protein